MSFRWTAALVAGALTGCDLPPVEVALTKVAGQATQFVPLSVTESAPEAISYGWRITGHPVGSTASPPIGGPATTFIPDLRGTYLLEASLTDGLSDDIAERFEVDAAGAPPIATIDLSLQVSVGSVVVADGSRSESPERRSLTFSWRLAERPRNSTAALPTTSDPMTSWTADTPGDFVIELDTFDGELWSSPTTATVQAQ